MGKKHKKKKTNSNMKKSFSLERELEENKRIFDDLIQKHLNSPNQLRF